MRYLNWLLRTLLFLLLLGFAVKNDQPVTLSYFFGYQWNTSLVVALLCFFTLGAGTGMLAMMGTIFRQRRELAAAKRDSKPAGETEEARASQRFPIQTS